MSLTSARSFAIRAGITLDCPTLPWKCCQRLYATNRKKVSDIIRWNAENKLLYGSKQKVAKKKVSSETKVAKGTTKVATAGKGKIPKTRDKKPSKEEVSKTASFTNAVNKEDFSRAGGTAEWWDEERTLTEENRGDLFHVENAFYNKLLDSGKAYEGSEESSMSFNSHTHSANGVDIPQLLPIPQVRNSQEKTGSASNPTNSVKQKSKVTSGVSTSKFKGVDFIQHCPLLPSQFHEVQALAEEFHSFVDSLNLRLLPTVNTVLNKTRTDLSSFFLQRWREKMIQELGEEGFKKHQEATIWQGTNLHACVQQYLSGVQLEDIQVQESIRGHWDSISSVLPDVTEVQALETGISHPWLCYKGTFDCIAKYKNTLYVIDWKTSSKPKPLLSTLYDNPLQVAAYQGAINLTPQLTDRFGVIEQAAIVVAYTNGEAAHVHRIQPALCQHYWKEWCQRLHQYWAAVASERGLLID